MNDLPALVARINKLYQLDLEPGKYSGFYSKKLTRASSLAVKRQGHGYHIEVTDPNGAMLVFPVVTSAAYEANAGAGASEKRRFYLKLDITLWRTNLLGLVERLIANHTPDLELDRDYYKTQLARLQGSDKPLIPSSTHCTFAIRGTTQRQIELGTSDDQEDFILLRHCLKPEDYLVFLAREPGRFDVFGLPQEDMPDRNWDGWAVGDPGKSVGVLQAAQVKEAVSGYEAPEAYGNATERMIASVVFACESWGNRSIIALAGVPGTGKSYIASIAANRYSGDRSRVREIQFHQSFSYEEFIEGMRIGSNGAVRVEPGIFLEWNEKAERDPGSRYVLLIEELTRANIAAVLGELMTYVEHRERAFFTLYSRRKVFVAHNLVILATYNPSDRSAIDVDAALLRRMRVLNFPPSTEQLKEMLTGTGLGAEVIGRLQKLFEDARRRFTDQYDYSMPFGHGMFADVRKEQPDLALLWEQRIKHLLRPPILDPHPFTHVIEEGYPWRDPKYQVVPDAVPAESAGKAQARSSAAEGELDTST